MRKANTKTKAPRPPGRPRIFRVSPTPFGRWMDANGLTVKQVVALSGRTAKKLKLRRGALQESSVYDLRNGTYRPGIDAMKTIAALSRGQIGLDDW